MTTLFTQLTAFQTKVDKNLAQILRNATKLAYNSVLELSPVDTGSYRGSWRIGKGGTDTSSQTYGDPGRAEGATQGSAPTSAEVAYRKSRLLSIRKPDDKIFISNSIRYGVYVEFGSPKNPPRNVLAIATARVSAQLAQVQTSGVETL